MSRTVYIQCSVFDDQVAIGITRNDGVLRIYCPRKWQFVRLMTALDGLDVGPKVNVTMNSITLSFELGGRKNDQ